jgi:Zn-dependent protease with chaperone function
MTLPYILRLACLCLQSLFLVNLTAALLCAALSIRLTQRASTMSPANAARLFLTLRLLPFATAVLVVAGLCIPSYLRYEQNTGSESTGRLCLLAAALGLGLCLTTLYRSIHALLQLRSLSQQTKQLPTQPSALAPTPLCIADPNSAGAPLLSLVGILTPRLIISPRLLQTLSADQFDAALAHEQAHLLSRDNLKRLLIAITPGPLPFAPAPQSIERHWAHYAELAADESAARGLPHRGIALAEALLHVARLQAARLANFERSIPLSSSLAAANSELALRIDRLIASSAEPPHTTARRTLWTHLPLALALTTSLALLPPLLRPLYSLLESLLH